MTAPEDDVVLLVEDNDGDVTLVRRAFEERDLEGTLHVVRSDGDAIDWLLERGEHADAPRPDLVLLDLNLPGASGHDVLERVADDADVRHVPIVVLTSSQSEDDLQQTYQKCANACVRKPVDPTEFSDYVEATTEFWLRTAVSPPASASERDDGR